MRRRYTRRHVCATGLLAGVSLLAGCQDDGGATTPGTVEPNGVVENVEFEDGDLVVELQEDHEVTQVNLIDPNGERFTGTSVARGETTSRLQLLDIRAGLGGYEHYEPGTYRLVAIHGETETTLDLDLEPDLRIVDVEQYRDGERNADYGKLAVTVENVGTGPTWVYDITYQDAPNRSANTELVSDPGVPQLEQPTSESGLILEPAESGQFISPTPPLEFSDDSLTGCSGSIEMNLIVGAPATDPVETEVVAEIGGDQHSTGSGYFVCSNISASQSEESLASIQSIIGGRQ